MGELDATFKAIRQSEEAALFYPFLSVLSTSTVLSHHQLITHSIHVSLAFLSLRLMPENTVTQEYARETMTFVTYMLVSHHQARQRAGGQDKPRR